MTRDAPPTSSFPPSEAQSGNPEARDALAAGSPIASALGLGFGDDGGYASFPRAERRAGIQMRAPPVRLDPDSLACGSASGMTGGGFTMRAGRARQTYPRCPARRGITAATVACDGTWVGPFTVLVATGGARKESGMARDPGGPDEPFPVKCQQWRGAGDRPCGSRCDGARSGNGQRAGSQSVGPGQKSPARVP